MKNKKFTNTPKNNKWGSKKFKLIILAIFTVSLSAFAQDDSRNEIRIGPKVGFNKANIYDESNEDFVADPKYGWAAGGDRKSVVKGKSVELDGGRRNERRKQP